MTGGAAALGNAPPPGRHERRGRHEPLHRSERELAEDFFAFFMEELRDALRVAYFADVEATPIFDERQRA